MRSTLVASSVAAALTILLVGCVQSGGLTRSPEPSVMLDTPVTEPHATAVGAPHPLGGSCAGSGSADRCQALAFAGAQELGMPFDAVAAVDLLPDPSPLAMDRAHRTFLAITLVDGSRHELSIACPGVAAAYDAKCMPDPVVSLGYPGGAEGHTGYTDIPENAAPFPSLDPAALAAARELRIASLPIRITGTGQQSVDLGTAVLANGYLAETRFDLADPWPSDVLFTAGPRMEVRPAAGGEPLWNLYEHGWHEGVEEVTVTITFDVAWFEPGATLAIVGIVVR